MSFNGDEFRSYQTVIARFIRKGNAVAVVRDCHGFSATTYKHQNRVRAALPESMKVFTVRCGVRGQRLAFTPATLRDHYISEAVEIGCELPSRYAFKREEQFERATAQLAKAIEVCEFFGLSHGRLDAQVEARAQTQGDAASEQLRAQREKMIKRQAAKDARELEARAEEMAEAIAEFRAGAPLTYTWALNNAPVMLREDLARKDEVGFEMETSKGARVPMEEAERAYRFACRVRAKGWHKNGEQFTVGLYQLDAVNEFGVIAGCHRVAWDEIDRFAASQGWDSKGGVS